MAITLVGTASDTAIDGTNITLTLPASTAGNDIVVVFGGHSNDGGTDAAIVTSGYTQLGLTESGTSYSFVSAYKRMGATPDTEVECNGSADISNAVVYHAMVFRGVDTTTAIDATTTTATGFFGDPNSPGITTVTDGAVVISCGGLGGNETLTSAPTGYGDAIFAGTADDDGFSACGAWKTVATAGAENPDPWVVTGSGQWAAHSIALRPSTDASVTADQGSYSVTGQAAGLASGRKLSAAQGTYSLSGQAAALVAPNVYGQGSYSILGQDATLTKGSVLIAVSGTYALTGYDATFSIDIPVVAAALTQSSSGGSPKARRRARYEAQLARRQEQELHEWSPWPKVYRPGGRSTFVPKSRPAPAPKAPAEPSVDMMASARRSASRES